MTTLFPHYKYSTNVYVKRTQVIELIQKVGEIWQNQLFTNQVIYSYSDLRMEKSRLKNKLKAINQEISIMESNLKLFGN